MTITATGGACAPVDAAIQALTPGAQYALIGTNSVQVVWSDPVLVRPTDAAINAQMAALAALPPPDLSSKIDPTVFKLFFELTNRVRVLEGKVTLTVPQMMAIWKVLLGG